MAKAFQILSLILCLGTAGLCWAAPPSSLEPMEFFSDLRSENTKLIAEVDQSLEKLMVEANALEPLSELESRVKFLKERKRELLARQEFLNRIILQFDLKFRGGDVQEFLKMALREMSQVEVKSSDNEDSMWKFLNYLAISMDALPKGQIDVLRFVEGYMKRSTFENPVHPKEYLSSLDYYNDTQAQRANGVSPLEAAESLSN